MKIMKISPIERTIFHMLKMLEQDDWEYELRRVNGKYKFIVWKPEWVTDNLYASVPCIGGSTEETIYLAIFNTMTLLDGEQ